MSSCRRRKQAVCRHAGADDPATRNITLSALCPIAWVDAFPHLGPSLRPLQSRPVVSQRPPPPPTHTHLPSSSAFPSSSPSPFRRRARLLSPPPPSPPPPRVTTISPLPPPPLTPPPASVPILSHYAPPTHPPPHTAPFFSLCPLHPDHILSPAHSHILRNMVKRQGYTAQARLTFTNAQVSEFICKT